MTFIAAKSNDSFLYLYYICVLAASMETTMISLYRIDFIYALTKIRAALLNALAQDPLVTSPYPLYISKNTKLQILLNIEKTLALYGPLPSKVQAMTHGNLHQVRSKGHFFGAFPDRKA